MADNETRPAPPRLEFRPPDCSVCGEETNCVERDVFECAPCGITWTSDIEGEWDEPDAPRCEVTVKPWLDNTWIKDDDERKHKEVRCVLELGHDDQDGFGRGTPHASPETDNTYVRGWH